MPSDEIMSSYVAKLEEEIEGLKVKNKDLSKRPKKHFTFTDSAVDMAAGWILSLSVFGIVIFFFGWLIFTHGTTGNYYIKYTIQSHSKMVHKTKCIEEVVTLKPCYQVKSEYNWGLDDDVGTCLDTVEEARHLVSEVSSEPKEMER